MRVEESVEIDRPLEAVFSYVSDMTRAVDAEPGG
jgi:hypothetical protein